MGFLILIGAVVLILLIILLWAIQAYNNFIAIKNNVSKAWSDIEVVLKQRHNLIPKLIATCKEYMAYEKGTLEEIVSLRNSAQSAVAQHDAKQVSHTETKIEKNLQKIFALAENYPDLKANEAFGHLSEEMANLENIIVDRRELYNSNVTINNTAIESFPACIVAKKFNFKHFDVLDFDESETKDVNVSELFDK